MRILVAASGGEGHLGPLLPFVDAAHLARDEVVLVVPPAQEETARRTGADYRLTAEPPAEDVARARAALQSGDREVRAHAAEIELFGRINTAAALGVTESVATRFGPDLILREPCDYASAIVGTRLTVPVATVGISPGRADISGLAMASSVVEHLAPGVTANVEAAPYLTRFPVGESTGYPNTRHYGFPVNVRARSEELPPLIWLTMGTVNPGFDQARGTWEAAIDALAELDVRVLASTGRDGITFAGDDRMEVVDWVDLPDILGRASAVVCHGGSGTTLAALAAGVPVVCVPMIADQPTNAAMAEKLGVGITVTPGSTVTPGITVTPNARTAIGGLMPEDVPRLRHAIAEVLTNPSYRSAAQQVAAQFAAAPSIEQRLEELRRPEISNR